MDNKDKPNNLKANSTAQPGVILSGESMPDFFNQAMAEKNSEILIKNQQASTKKKKIKIIACIIALFIIIAVTVAVLIFMLKPKEAENVLNVSEDSMAKFVDFRSAIIGDAASEDDEISPRKYKISRIFSQSFEYNANEYVSSLREKYDSLYDSIDKTKNNSDLLKYLDMYREDIHSLDYYINHRENEESLILKYFSNDSIQWVDDEITKINNFTMGKKMKSLDSLRINNFISVVDYLNSNACDIRDLSTCGIDLENDEDYRKIYSAYLDQCDDEDSYIENKIILIADNMEEFSRIIGGNNEK